MKTIKDIIEEGFEEVAQSINEMMEKLYELDTNKLNQVSEEAICVDTLLRDPRLRAVETDDARAVQLRSGSVQVYSEGESTRAYTISADDLWGARNELAKKGKLR